VQFGGDCGLFDKKLTGDGCGLIFSKVKLGKKSTLKFDRFQEACRMMATMKGITYQNLVQLATGQDMNTDSEVTDDVDIETGLNSRGGRKYSVDDFELLNVLGKGSFGKVMLVKLKGDSTDELLAMKSLRKAELIKRKQLLHTQTERKIAQTIQHPFLVNLRYAFQTVDKLYLVLDYMGGGELFFWLRQQRRFAKSRVQLYIAQITLALGALHVQDIIYRDLKPENILMDLEGNLRLTDFGLAKENVTGAGAKGGTKTFCGTPEYLAPEVLENKGHGKAVDWWAMGTLFYEMLFGLPPFYDQNMQRMYSNIMKNELQFKGPLAQEEHADSRSIIGLLLQRKVKDRLGSSQTGANDIKSHPFFETLDFDKVFNKEYQPEFVPPSKGAGDVSNFDQEFTRERPEDSVVVSNLSEADVEKTKFDGFTFEGGSALDE